MLPLENLVKQFHGKSRWAHLEWSNQRNFMALARRGIFVAFADSIVYHGKAFLFVGRPNSSKTTLTNRIVSYNHRTSRRLSEDTTTLVYDRHNLYSYQTSCDVHADLMPVLEEGERYKVAAVFHLEHGIIEQGNLDVELALRIMFFSWTGSFGFNPKVVEASRAAFKDVSYESVPYMGDVSQRYRFVVERMKKFLN